MDIYGPLPFHVPQMALLLTCSTKARDAVHLLTANEIACTQKEIVNKFGLVSTTLSVAQVSRAESLVNTQIIDSL